MRPAVFTSVRVFVLCVMGSVTALATPQAPQAAQSAHRFANPLLDDVVQMAQAEVPDATILAYLRVRRARLETDVSAKDLIELHRDGIGDEIVEFIARQSGVDAPSSDQESVDAPSSDREPVEQEPQASSPDGDGPPADADESRPQEPDPGDTGLIMGIYDPLPIGGYPCWPAWLAPYECGGPSIYFDGSRSRRRDSRDRRSERDRTIEGKNDRSADRDEPSGNRSRDRSGDRGDDRGVRRGDDHGSRGSSSDGRGSGGRSSGSGHGRH